MPLQVPCGQCKTQCTVPDSFAGRVITCPYCQGPLRVPGPPQETPGKPASPLLDMLNEELVAAGATPAAASSDPWAAHGHRSRSKFRLPGPIALAVAAGGAFAFFVLMVALFPKVGLPLGWLVVVAGAGGLFAALCWLIYDLSCVPPHRRRTGTAMLGVLGAFGCAGIGAVGVLYASWELDRRENPGKYAAKAPPQAGTPADARGRADDKTPGAARPAAAGPGQASSPAGGPPAAGAKPKAVDIPADDLVSFDPSRFGKAAPGAKPVQGVPPPDPDANPIETAYEEASRAYAAEAAADLLASEDALFRERMLWFPLANRPVMGLRWAFGLQSPDPASGPQAAPSENLEKQVKAVSLALVAGLDQRISARLFGQWPETGDARLRQVAVLRNGRRHELIAAAKRRAVDLLVIVETVASASDPARPAGTLKIDLVDLTEDRALATFPRPSGPTAGRPGVAPAVPAAAPAGLADESLKFVDENCALKPVPWSVVDQAKPRAARLASRPPPLHAAAALLLEMRYYQVRQLIPPADAISFYDSLLGVGNGEKLATGDAARRREALQAWVKGP